MTMRVAHINHNTESQQERKNTQIWRMTLRLFNWSLIVIRHTENTVGTILLTKKYIDQNYKTGMFWQVLSGLGLQKLKN